MNPILLPKISDPRGNLSFIEDNGLVPFSIKRVHWIYDVPGGAKRGGVAYERTEEFIIAMSGSFDVIVDDGTNRNVIQLNRSYMGVYVPKGSWRAIENFSTNSVAVIAASTYYDSTEGIRDYEEFLNIGKKIILSNAITCEEDGISLPIIRPYSVFDCKIVDLDKHHSDVHGNISVVENFKTVPFKVKRLYYLYDIPGGETRGGHAHKQLFQLILAVSGCFTVVLDDGKNKQSFTLNRPYKGLLVPPGIWRNLEDFSSGSVCLVLASEKYSEDDYIRDYDIFLSYRNNK